MIIGNGIVNGVLRVFGNLYANLIGTINGHTVESDVPGTAVFTDTKTHWFATCTTAAATSAKEATVEGNGFSLFPGVTVSIKFSVSNSYSSTAAAPITINVNDTGDYPVYADNAAKPTGTSTLYYGQANYVNTYVFDGEHWIWMGRSTDNNTTYAGYSFGMGYGECTTAAATVAKAVTISSYALHNGGVTAIKFEYDVPANATLNIRTRGAKPIYYRDAPITAGVINAGDTATFVYYSNVYYLVAVDHSIEVATTSDVEDYLGIT